MQAQGLSKTKYMNKKLLIVLFTSLANYTYAQVDSSKQIELPAATIKDSKVSLLSPKASLSISKALIKRTNQGADIPVMLNNLSSVVVSSDAGNGVGYTGIRIRGADITRINVTLNGVPVNDPESQATFFVNTPDLLSSAQSLEISKGVGASKSGVGNFGGGIAINTLDINNEKPLLSFHSDFGSFNTFKNTLRLSTGLINNKWISTVRLSTINSDGYIDRSASDLKALQWTTKYQVDSTLSLTFNYMKGKEKTGQAWNGVLQDSLQTNRTYNELGRMSDTSFYQNQTDNYGQNYYQLFIDKKWNTNWQSGAILYYTKGKGYYEEYKMSESFDTYGLPTSYDIGDTSITRTDLIRQLWLDNDFYGIKAYTNYLSNKCDFGFYLNYQNYEGKHFGDVIWSQFAIPQGYRWYSLQAQKSEANAYAMFDYRFGARWQLFADMQVRNVRYTIDGFRKNPNIQHDLKFLFVNPKLKLSYKLPQSRFDLMMGIAQKEPNRDDLEASATELPKPEKLFNTELSYFKKVNRYFAFQANAFYMYYRDQLVLTGRINDVGAYARVNTPQSRRVGIELEGFLKTNNVECALNVALTDNRIQHFTEYIDDYDAGSQIQNKYHNTFISFSPSVIAGGRVSIFPLRNSSWKELNNLSIDILPKYVSRQYLDNTSNNLRSINPYAISDFVLGLPYQTKQGALLSFRMGVYNVFNTQFENNGYTYSYKYDNVISTFNYFYPQAGRRFMLGVGVDL